MNIVKTNLTMTTTTATKFEVYFNGGISNQPQHTVGYYSTIKRARNKATKKSLEYGSYAYSVRSVDTITLRPIRQEIG